MIPPMLFAAPTLAASAMAANYRHRLHKIHRLCKQFASSTTEQNRNEQTMVTDTPDDLGWSERYPLRDNEGS